LVFKHGYSPINNTITIYYNIRNMDTKKWWKEALVYQIYPRSFQDSNNDGIGDIPGIISRLGELEALGVGVIWLSPVYRSPQADNGYDISDYCDIDPLFGTMADMDALLAEAGRRGIRIIMDLVINHTSDEHGWFKKSRAGDPEYRDFYIWQPPKPGGGPPNNWTSFFMGPAWEFDRDRGEYYLHLFDKKQPDLNYHNPRVIAEVKKILTFWLDKGVAGFRCDVINLLYKDSLADGRRGRAITGIEHYKTREGTHAILRELRRDVLDHYDCVTVGEGVMVDLEEARDLCGEARKELDMVFYFEHLEVDRRISRYIPKKFRPAKLLAALDKWQRGLEWNAVYLENHDQPRILSHYGDEGLFRERRAKLLATLEFTLRGTPFVYQGQEIGMGNFDFTNMSQLRDPESFNIDRLMQSLHIPRWLRWRWIRVSSRDNARTPMQWTAEEGAGFTRGRPWIGINGNYRAVNYAAQRDDPHSILSYYKRMAALRASSETLKYGDFLPLPGGKRLLAYQRRGEGETYTVVLNFSAKPLRAVFSGELVISNTGRPTGWVDTGALEPYEALVLQRT
jgi:oligo-1,6-glucosidase